MKKHILVFSAVLFLFIGFTIYAESISVFSVNGDVWVDVYGNGNWKPAEAGQTLQSSSFIKTGETGYIEVLLGEDRVLVSRNKVISVDKLKKDLTEKKKFGWLRHVRAVISIVMGEGHSSTQSFVLGIRGEKKDEEEMDWMGEGEIEGEDYERAKKYYFDGDYLDAIPILYRLYDNSELKSIKSEISFFLGSSLYNNLQYRESLIYLKEAIKDKSADYYEVALFNYSFANYFVKDYNTAARYFKEYIDRFPESKLVPYAIYMAGKSYKKLGNTPVAVSYFEKIVSEYKNSDLYDEAVKEIKGE